MPTFIFICTSNSFALSCRYSFHPCTVVTLEGEKRENFRLYLIYIYNRFTSFDNLSETSVTVICIDQDISVGELTDIGEIVLFFPESILLLI